MTNEEALAAVSNAAARMADEMMRAVGRAERAEAEADNLHEEIRRLRAKADGCTCSHPYPCPLWAGYEQVAWKS